MLAICWSRVRITHRFYFLSHLWNFIIFICILGANVNFENLKTVVESCHPWKYCKVSHTTLRKHKIDSTRKYAVNTPDQLDYTSAVSKLPSDKVQHFVSFISQPHFIQDVAFGERTLKLSTGQKVYIPVVVRTVIGSQIISAYLMYLAYCAEVTFTALKRSSLYHILKQCSASQRKSLCGLDSTTADGMASFDRLMSLSDNMQEKTSSTNTRKNVLKVNANMNL